MSQMPRPDASMNLLRQIMEAPLDPGYAQAAQRRARGAKASGRRLLWTEAAVLLLAITIGLGSVWAARELREPVPGLEARTVLIDQIQTRSQIGTALTASNAAWRAELVELRQQALGTEAAQLQAQASQLGTWAGTTAVTGPGIVVTLADSTRASAGDPDADDERVKDVDLQYIVNSLWSSGAESIAINGIRLSSGTAIRAAGQAVLVDLQPLASPYEIEVLGDPSTLRELFSQTRGAQYLADLSIRYGIRSEMVEVRELTLPSGTVPVLDNAVIIDE